MNPVAKYFVVHSYIKDPATTWSFFGQGAPGLAKEMAAGKTPAKCLMTWNPWAHGRGEHVFCLWEANNPQDIDVVLKDSGMAEYISSDIMAVDEIDWAHLARG
jgi:hypothetical protein